MKFIIDRDSLVNSLNIVLRGVSARTTLPILKGILLKADEEEGKVYFSSSDLEISIETSVKTQIIEKGSIVVSAKLFSDVIRKLPAGDIEINIEEGNAVFIKSGKIEDTLQGIQADEFPTMEKTPEEDKLCFDGEMFKDMVKKTVFAASIEEARGIITGLLFEIKKKEAMMVALDGYRMAIVNEEVNGEEEKNLIISARIMNEVAKIAAETLEVDEEIIINSIENKVFFTMKDTRISARLMEGEFIKYKDIIPKESKVKVKIDREELFESVERASLLVREGKNSFIRFSFNDDILNITSRADEGKYFESINIEKDGEDLEIGFNGRFVSDTLKAIEDKEVILEFNTSISPCLVRPVKGDKFIYLILPVRLSSGNI